MVKSKNTSSMTKMELEDIIETLKKSSKKQIREFRSEFNPDEMGFAGREEGI